MILVVDPHSGIPVYRQIVEQLRFQVSSAVLEPGDEIPSTRSLSAQLGVNPMTISKAYALLEKEGLLERRPGLPLIVRKQGRASERSTKREQMQNILRPAAVRAKQMKIEKDEAMEIFRRLLDEED